MSNIPDRFPLGQVVSTPGAIKLLGDQLRATRPEEFASAGEALIAALVPIFANRYLMRHANCDWGDICEEDRGINETALKQGLRIMSVYIIGDAKLWIITEGDRSSTTLLLPEEY